MKCLKVVVLLLGTIAMAPLPAKGESPALREITFRFTNNTAYPATVHINRGEDQRLKNIPPGATVAYRLQWYFAYPYAPRLDVSIAPEGHGVKSLPTYLPVVRGHVPGVIHYQRTGRRAWEGVLAVTAK